MPEEKKKIAAEELREFYRVMLMAVAVPRADAEVVADCLLLADLRGVDSHGILHLAGYVRAMRDGWINPRPNIRVVEESGVGAVIDGDGGLGQPACLKAMELAIEKARGGGYGGVAVRNTTHSGSLAYYPRMAAAAGMIGFAASGVEHGLSSGVYAYGVPIPGSEPLLLDSVLSYARPSLVRSMGQRGERIPAGWALDEEGQPTEEPGMALRGSLAPMGGHKGYGLQLMHGIFSGILSGGRRRFPNLGGITATPNLRERYGTDRQNHFHWALNPEAFLPRAEFEQGVREFVAALKQSPARPGSEVLLPGEPQARTYPQRVRDGVPVAAEILDDLDELRRELAVEARLA